jgi:phospholipid/cholesterol/gamma-HCH transport system permease protein
VLPRTLALVLMMPLLCLYANFMGILGGVIVGTGLLELPLKQYLVQTQAAVGLGDFLVGLVKSAIFGVIVAMSGCMRGMQCGRSAMAVGAAATSAVVTAIVYIVVADALITVICDVVGV